MWCWGALGGRFGADTKGPGSEADRRQFSLWTGMDGLRFGTCVHVRRGT